MSFNSSLIGHQVMPELSFPSPTDSVRSNLDSGSAESEKFNTMTDRFISYSNDNKNSVTEPVQYLIG